ncbi:MAG: 5-formyltetrahydrofolate cyclo-ligase [Phycisphaerae bacterium]
MTGDAAPSVKEAKAALRRDIERRLAGMSPAAAAVASGAIVAKVRKLESFRTARRVMLYVPMRTEVDVGPLAVETLAAGGEVCLPAFDVASRTMWAVGLEGPWSPEAWPQGRLGVRIARGERVVDAASIDLVIVPGVAFDHAGHRLGRGMGFYDRFLRDTGLEAVSIGVAFEEQLVERVPCEAGDVPLRVVITNERCLPVEAR